MDALTYQSRPQLRSGFVVAGFEGWIDAGEASTSAVSYLRESWKATQFATVDPEEFYDFQAHRPLVHLNEQGIREITWPSTDFCVASIPGAERDAILLRGIEPSMRWPTYTKLILDVVRTTGAQLVVGLGALFAGRPHTRPVRVTGAASTPELSERWGLPVPRYEGPTGILGVLMDACRRSEIPCVTLYGWVPHYLQGSPSPPVALALLQRLSSLLDVTIDLSELEERSRAHDIRVSEAISADPDIAATVHELERQADAEDMNDLPSGDELAAEVERFLRNQHGER